MRIKNSASFPYPVLAESSGDYLNRKFQINLDIQESPAASAVTLNGSMMLDDPSIQNLIAAGDATTGLMITCLDTYYDRFEQFQLGDFCLELTNGEVRGTVYLRGVVIATHDNIKLSSTSIDSEFPEESRIAHAGDFIAITEEFSFEAGLDKLAPLESIFKLSLKEDLKEGIFDVYLDSETIEILVPPALHHFITLLRSQPMRETLLSSLYLPVVMTALEAMRDEDFSDKRWHIVINARCNAEGIDIKRGDLIKSAQQLLDSPLGALQKTFERADT